MPPTKLLGPKPSADADGKQKGASFSVQQEPDTCFSWVVRCLVIAVYITLNITLNMINKWTLTAGGFKFPIALSMAHQLFTLFAMTPFILYKSSTTEHMASIQKQWRGLIAISCFFAFNLGCNNISLLSISLSLNQVIRACIPVATALGATLIEQKPPTAQESVALITMVSGVGIAIWDGSSTRATVVGIVLCVLGTLSNGLMMSSIGKLLGEKLSVVRLTWYTSPVIAASLFPFYLSLESRELSEYRKTTDVPVVLILIGCCNALAYNLIHSLVIKVTSSVTTTVLGEMKIVLILVLSSVWLGESGIWTAKMLLGVTIALLGIAMYSHSKLALMKEPVALPIIKGLPDLPTAQERSKDTRAGHNS